MESRPSQRWCLHNPAQARLVTMSLIHCSQFPSESFIILSITFSWRTTTLPCFALFPFLLTLSSQCCHQCDSLMIFIPSGHTPVSHSSCPSICHQTPQDVKQGTRQPGKCIKTTVVKKLCMLFIVSSNVCYIEFISGSA